MTVKPERAGKDALLDAARELFLTQGYVAVSMQQIAEAAGMTKGAPYYHFKNKEDLFVTVFLREIERQKLGFIETLAQPGPAEERLVNAMAYVFETTRVDLFTLYSDAGRHISMETLTRHKSLKHNDDELDAILVPFFTEIDGQEINLRVPPREASHLFTLLMMGQLHTLHGGPESSKPFPSPRAIAAELVDVLLHGVQSR
jgi:AcrR family transcriptional regulator